jgi:hypothetical protein
MIEHIVIYNDLLHGLAIDQRIIIIMHYHYVPVGMKILSWFEAN